MNRDKSRFFVYHLSFINFLGVLCVLCGLMCSLIDAQVRPMYDQGALGLGQLLKRLNNTKSLMMIGAHPDDEDSGLLAYMARGENARTAYLSLTRGDGGQNRLGKELFEPLGIIRTEELLQARTLDGAEQYFTRAFDYGYSKTLAEAKSKWDEKVILCDVARAIRTFRPLVVISRFSGTSRDGHGQHQFAGYISKPAVVAAGDPNKCKDSGAPWKVRKFYRSFRSRNDKPTIRMNTGRYDPLLGRSYFQIAIQGRSQHKSQEQGFLELRGDRFSNVISETETGEEKSIFDGIDTSINGISKTFISDNGVVNEDMKKFFYQIQKDMSLMLEEYEPEKPSGILPRLFTISIAYSGLYYKFVLSSGSAKKRDEQKQLWKNEKEIFYLISHKMSLLRSATLRASGLHIDALSSQETVTRGENFTTSIKVFYPSESNINVKEIKLKTPKGWQTSEGKETVDNSRFSRFFRETANYTKVFNVQVTGDPKYNQPYFLKKPRDGYLYRWENDGNQNRPFQRAMMFADVTVDINGNEMLFRQPVEYRLRDQLRGELRRNLNVVPRVSLDLDQHLIVVPTSSKPQKRKVAVNLLCNSPDKSSGKVYLKAPHGWSVYPRSVNFELDKKGESTSFEFEVTIPANTGSDSYRLKAIAEVGNEKFNKTMNTVAYDHIQTHRYYTKAETAVNVFDLKTAPVKIGYIMGSGDQIPEAIRQMGIDVELLDKKFLTNGDYSRFDTIVVGIRASETRKDYIANNQRLLEYVKDGGTLIVQYQKFAYLRQNLAPFPAKFNARVAEEDAKVTILDTDHPVFNFPNKITQSDFDNWVHERNLYAFKTFDKRFVPLLECHDTGESENKGGMVYAKIGKGNYMYCSYSFFRQLPAGVPGAYRLFANILSLSKSKK